MLDEAIEYLKSLQLQVQVSETATTRVVLVLSSPCNCKSRSSLTLTVGNMHPDDVDGQRHRGAAGGDVPGRAPVPVADGRRDGPGGGDAVHAAAAVHGRPAAGGAAQRAGEPGAGLPRPPPHAGGGGHGGAVRALPRRQPPAAAAVAGPARPQLAAAFFFSSPYAVCLPVCVADKFGQHYAQGVGYYPPPLGAKAVQQQAPELHHVPGPGASMPAGAGAAAPGVLLPESAPSRGPGTDTMPCALLFSSSSASGMDHRLATTKVPQKFCSFFFQNSSRILRHMRRTLNINK